MKRLRLSVVLAILLGSGAAGRALAIEPMDVWSGICEVIGAVVPVIAPFCKVTDKVYGLIKPSDPITLRGLFLQVESLELRFQDLEKEVADLVFEERRAEVLALERAIDQARGQIHAALSITVERPGDTAAEAEALAASQALQSPTFSALPGRTAGAPDRFDPRASLPSFVLAVDSWITIRVVANRPWTDVGRQQAADFAARLVEIGGQMRSSVRCEEVWHNFNRAVAEPQPHPVGHPPLRPETPDGPPPRFDPVTEPACNHRLSCTDDMQGETSSTGKTTAGLCVSATTANAAANRARRLADYKVDDLDVIARRWREAAGLPPLQ